MSLLRRISLLVVLAAIAVPALIAPAAAQDEDVPTVLPAAPREVTDRLPQAGDLQQRHPWVPNDAPWPWNMSIAQGSWTNSNSSITLVECGPTVASDNPYWYQENLRYTRWTGGARCNVQMRAITGTARLYQWDGPAGATALLGTAAIGTQHAVPPGHGTGWQAYGESNYTRTSDAQNLQIHLQVTLEIQPWGTGARWNTVPNSCTRDANIRIIHCQLWSIPFRNAPYPCPSPKVGVQPLQCHSPNPDAALVLAHDAEENNDNAADPFVPETEVPDPEAHADEAACGAEGDQSCLAEPPAARNASETHAPRSFFVSEGMRADDIPDWVENLGAYADAAAVGFPTGNTRYYGTDAAVFYGSRSISTGPRCPRRFACLYQHTHYRTSEGSKGRHFRTNVVGFNYDLDLYGDMDRRGSSLLNKRLRNAVCLENYTGSDRIYRPKHAIPHFGSFNDKAQSMRLQTPSEEASVCLN